MAGENGNDAGLLTRIANSSEIYGSAGRPTATLVRPADTTPYTSGDLIANSTTAGLVVPMVFTIGRGNGGMIRAARLHKSNPIITNASYRQHFYRVSPVASNGDNGAWLTDQYLNYVAGIDITCDKVFTDGAFGRGVPSLGGEINFTSGTYYSLLEARAAYTPISAEQFDFELEIIQN